MTLLMGIFFTSCFDDDNDSFSIGDMAIDWATVKHDSFVPETSHTYFLSDAWGILNPQDEIFFKNLNHNQRVVLAFNPLVEVDGEDDEFLVKVGNIKTVLTKDVELLKEGQADDYGDDPVYIVEGDLWIGGGYLNVIFQQHLPVEHKHRVSLIAGQFDEHDDGYIHLQFRYNDYDDTTDNWQYGAVSYSLHNLNIKESTKGIKLRINSAVNGHREIILDFNQTSTSSDNMSKVNLDEIMTE